MTEILIGSSILIPAILLLRLLFRKRLSQRLIYALWGFVLLRLLIPVSVPVMDIRLPSFFASAHRTNKQMPQMADEQQTAPQADLPAGAQQEPASPLPPQTAAAQPLPSDGNIPAYAPGLSAGAADMTQPENPLLTDTQSVSARISPHAVRILRYVWITGTVLTGMYFFLANMRFYLFLRKRRIPYQTEDNAKRIWLVEDGLSSPCLFGRSIYLTPAAAVSADSLRHVLAHEQTHARHGDPLWSLLRCVCLTVYWFHPLVWAGAICSKIDCELACDEGTLARLEDDERIPYGHTLLSLISVKGGAKNPFLVSTIMPGGKKHLKERMIRISERVSASFAAALVITVLSAALTACSFAGAKKTNDTSGAFANPASGGLAQAEPAPADAYQPLPSSTDAYQPLPSPTDAGQTYPAPADTNEPQQVSADTDLSPLVWDGTLPAIPLPTENLTEGIRKLTTEEIAQLNRAFEPVIIAETPQGPVTYASPLSCFFTSTYDYVWNMDFTQFIMHYPAELWDAEVVTDAELRQIKAAGFESADTVYDMPVPVHRIRRDLLDATLKYYTDFTTQSFFTFLTEDAAYLSEYDAWYTAASDFGAGTFRCVDGSIYGSAYADLGISGGDHFAVLRGSRCQDGSYNQLILIKKGETWRIRSFINVREPEVLPQGARALTPEEIERVNQAFASTVTVETPNGPMGSSTEISCFFTSCYTDVRELNFALFLQYHPLISPYGEEVTDAEFQLLKGPAGWDFCNTVQDMPVPVHRFRRAQVDETLMRYAGITTADLKDVGTNTVYLPEYDSWYNFTSDFGPGTFVCKRGSVYQDSLALLHGYCNGFFGQLTLEKDGDDWHIRSFVSLGRADPYVLFPSDP